ncbi:MAG: hypothetical protein GY732_13250 [Gammaproteobacteria bacterium]|nr:hypothetical protein [Gammaproteobacteria bacterium]
MKTLQRLMLVLFLFLLISPGQAKESREAKQARLDQACETARLKELIPLRKKVIDECIANREFPERKECERFYADYGERMGGRAPLFYDLPECVTAFEYQQSVRNPDT